MLNLFYKLALLLGLCFCTSVVVAEGITVTKTEGRLIEDGYEISANYNINLSPSVADALTRGVMLNFISELTITRSRWYWLDSDVIQDEQQIKLSYNALTQQYRISKGTLFQSFSNLESALRVLGHQSAPPVPTAAFGGGSGYVAKLLNSETTFTAFAQLRLDTSQLPKPLQVYALTNSDWKLESEKVSWPVQPEMTENNEASKP
jgi:hypothetical protein